MSTEVHVAPVGAGRLGAPGLWMLAGLALLLVPSWTMLAQRVWLTDEQGHGPIILGVTMWLAWTRRQQLLELPQRPAPLAGWALLAAGLMLYVVGRSQ
ncbi:exosortase B, partial [Rubrivivax gelatinosus]|nr:exosortase B [Rubrivivax gelatinosus]